MAGHLLIEARACGFSSVGGDDRLTIQTTLAHMNACTHTQAAVLTPCGRVAALHEDTVVSCFSAALDVRIRWRMEKKREKYGFLSSVSQTDRAVLLSVNI